MGVLFLFMLFCIQNSIGQTLKYDVFRGEKVIGSMVAQKNVKGDTLIYDISSRTAIKVIFTLNINYDLKETHYGGVLQSGHGLSTLNGSVQNESEIRKYSDYYIVESSSDIVRIEKKEITYSIPEVYYSLPKDGAEIFSTMFGEYLRFEKIAENTYLLDSSDGKNTYFYNSDGICTEVKVSRLYSSFSMILIEE